MEDNNKVPKDEIQEQKPQTEAAKRTTGKPVAESQFEIPIPEIKPAGPKHVLPPVKYKLKTLLMFTDFFMILIYIYILLIGSIIEDATNDRFSFGSGRMFAFYCVLAITIVIGVLIFISKFTKSARTRFERDNEVRQNPNIKVWLTGFDWGWPVLFLPTVVLMAAAGIIGVVLNVILGWTSWGPLVQNFIGGVVILFGALNAAVVIFKVKPVTLGLILGGFIIALLIMLLHGVDTFAAFFKGFRHLGVNIAPQGYLLLAYIWSVFLRIIWVKSLFFYWVFLPNRLELQHGLSESNDAIDRDDLRLQIDTDDVILRWCNVGIITFYFPQLDRLPIKNVVLGIRKKAVFANRIASVKTIQD
ncbi:MAG: hypothetical protein JW804_09630 [Sedimentisphaerales bacterium]|nr:hypothetical protein [Sedimentisphaerales bacterium]